jgi:hypothetical protein
MRVLIGLVLFVTPLASAAQEEAREQPSRAELGSLVERKGPFSGPDLPRVWSPKTHPPTPVIVAPPTPPTTVQVVVTAPSPPPPAEVVEPAYLLPARSFFARTGITTRTGSLEVGAVGRKILMF